MKKLMIAAAAAAISTGAFALCGQPTTVTPAVIVKAQPMPVYKFNFCGKTTKGVSAKETPVACAQPNAGGAACVARIPTKLKIKGWIALCSNDCGAINGGTAGAEAYAFWVLKPYKGYFDATGADDVSLDFLQGEFPHVIGKKPNKAEAYGSLAGTIVFAGVDATAGVSWVFAQDASLMFAGLGKYSNGVYKKIKGNFAGHPPASWYISSDVCVQSDVYVCATLQLNCGAAQDTVAFGKWNMKYSKSASKKFSGGKLPKTPSWAKNAVKFLNS